MERDKKYRWQVTFIMLKCLNILRDIQNTKISVFVRKFYGFYPYISIFYNIFIDIILVLYITQYNYNII